MSITTEVAPMENENYYDRKQEENRDPNNLNEHLQVLSSYCSMYSKIIFQLSWNLDVWGIFNSYDAYRLCGMILLGNMKVLEALIVRGNSPGNVITPPKGVATYAYHLFVDHV